MNVEKKNMNEDFKRILQRQAESIRILHKLGAITPHETKEKEMMTEMNILLMENLNECREALLDYEEEKYNKKMAFDSIEQEALERR